MSHRRRGGAVRNTSCFFSVGVGADISIAYISGYSFFLLHHDVVHSLKGINNLPTAKALPAVPLPLLYLQGEITICLNTRCFPSAKPPPPPAPLSTPSPGSKRRVFLSFQNGKPGINGATVKVWQGTPAKYTVDTQQGCRMGQCKR